MFSLASLGPIDAFNGLGMTDDEVQAAAERIIAFVKVYRDAEAIAALSAIPCVDRAKVASLLTAAHPNAAVAIIRKANEAAPCAAATSSRPKWLMPALIGGGLLAAAGITLAIIRR